MTESVVNEYGNIDPHGELGKTIDQVMMKACDKLLPLLDEVSLRELPVVLRYIEGSVTGNLASYTLKRQLNKRREARAKVKEGRT